MQYAYFIGCFILFLVWFLFFVLRKDLRKEMIFGSLLALPFGFIECLLVPEYWNPPSLFNLISRFGFSLESFLLFFSGGGITAVIYEVVGRKKTAKIRLEHKSFFGPYLIVALIFISLELLFPSRTVYNAIVSLLVGAGIIAFKRKDLIVQIILGGVFFALIYFLFFLIFNRLFPGYIVSTYNLENFWGIMIWGVPLEEIAMGFAAGACWSTLFEYIKGYRTRDLT